MESGLLAKFASQRTIMIWALCILKIIIGRSSAQQNPVRKFMEPVEKWLYGRVIMKEKTGKKHNSSQHTAYSIILMHEGPQMCTLIFMLFGRTAMQINFQNPGYTSAIKKVTKFGDSHMT